MENSTDIIDKFSNKWWEEVYNKVFGGIVYIEDSCAECLHWNGGIQKLMDAGAIGVKTLSPFECGNDQQKKAIFITCCTSTNIMTVQYILDKSYFVNCILVTTADSNILVSESNLSFNDLEEKLINSIRNKPCVVEIIHAPIFAIPFSTNIFVTPTFSNLYPKFGENILPNQLASLDLHSLTIEDKNEVRRLATSFNSLLEYMNVKDDIFYMGPFSSILSGVLEHLPETTIRRKNATNQVSVIFIDRTIDLAGVTSHGSNTFLDKMINLLPRFPGHSTDLAVDISPLCDSKMITLVDDIHLCPGCIAHPNDANCIQIFNHFINKSQNEVMLGLYNKLSKIIETSPSKFPSRITTQNLEKIISSLKGKYDIIKVHSGLLQQSLGVIQTLKSPDIQQLELISCLEKQIVQSISTSRDSTSLLSQISVIIKSWKQRGLSIHRILSLLVHIYSLAGGYITFSEAQEKNLLDSLSVAIFEDRSGKSLLCDDVSDIHTPEGSNTLARTIINRLRDVAKTRDSFTRYKSLIKIIDKVSPSEYRGILQQLICDLVDERRPEIPDLKCRTSGLKDLFKSGLSMLMNTTSKNPQNVSKHPFDNPTVIIYIVGGMSVEECFKMHRDVMISGTDVNVVIGSTSIVNPTEAMKQALFLG